MNAWICCLALALLAGCGLGEPDEHVGRFLVFGTQVEVKLRGVDEEQAAVALARLGRDFQTMHRDWHPWQEGALGELNHELPDGGWVRTTPELIELIEISQRLERDSDGLFNPAIGGLVHLWGFHTSQYPILAPPPAEHDIERLMLQRPSTLDIAIDGQRVRSDNPAVRLDFSGLAKGMAARQACDRLAEFRITEALINLGGDVMICGPGERDWRVAVSDGTEGVLATLSLTGPTAVFTSGNYHRYGEWNGERYAHILDPFTGYPVDHLVQATVIDSDPLTADAAATALVVAGPVTWTSTSRQLGTHRAVVIDGQGQTHATPGFQQLLDASRER